jgi:hypothetical protein
MIDIIGERRPPIERQIDTGYARDKVARALYEAIVDSVEFGPCDLATAADRDWIRGAIAVPIQEATDVALRVLAWHLEQALERGPDRLLDRLEASHHGEGLGRE